MENFETTEKLEMTSNSYCNLKETAKWARFLAIFGFVLLGLMLILNLLFLAFSFSNIMPFVEMTAIPIVAFSLIIIVLYGIPLYLLYSFATNINTALNFNDNLRLEEAFKNLKNLYKFIGILTIALMALYIIVLIVLLLVLSINSFDFYI